MVKIYNTNEETKKLEEVKEFKKGAWISLVSPTETEIQEVCNAIDLEEEFLRYPLDYEEKARIDKEDENVLFIIDVPIIEMDKDNKVYTTMPLGMIVVRDDYFVTVSLKPNRVISNFENGVIKGLYTFKKTRFILQILYSNASLYLNLLKQINRETEIAENVLQKSMKNKELIKLLSMEKSLVYFTTSLKSNEAVMERTLRGRIVKLYEEDEDILEDAIVENKQAIEMGKIYSDILNSSMDAYASIISNNLNTVMKKLTSVTIVLSIPTMIGSFWGMNIVLPLTSNPFAFPMIILFAIFISFLLALWLRRKGMF